MHVNTTIVSRHLYSRAPIRSGVRNTLALLGIAAIVLGCLIVGGGAAQDAAAKPVRIGTYDSRAVAVAYVRSASSSEQLKALLRQRSEAEKAGDKKRVAELNAQGESMQIRRHLQGFSTAPVDDILDTVRDQLPGIARERKVLAITRAVDYSDPAVEVLDVTEDLVRLFKPDAQTLKIIAELRTQKPQPIEVVARLPAKG